MGISEGRLKNIRYVDQEIESLEKELKKKKALHDSLYQTLLNRSNDKTSNTDKSSILKECESLQQQINEVLTDIRHLDKKIWRLKHQTKRMSSDFN